MVNAKGIKELTEALEQEIQERSKKIVSKAPAIAYLKGALDFANGNIKLKEGEDGVQSFNQTGNGIENSKS